MSDFIVLGCKITADGDSSHKSLQMVIAAMKLNDASSLEGKLDNLDSILKSRDITLPTKVCLVMAMIFPVVMYGC